MNLEEITPLQAWYVMQHVYNPENWSKMQRNSDENWHIKISNKARIFLLTKFGEDLLAQYSFTTIDPKMFIDYRNNIDDVMKLVAEE